jgi:hypothetical protein
VLGTVWPLLQQAIDARAARIIDADVVDEEAAGASPLVTKSAALPQRRPSNEPSIRKRTFQAALAIAALVAVSLVPAFWLDRESAAPATQGLTTSSSPAEAPVREQQVDPITEAAEPGAASRQQRSAARRATQVDFHAQPARLDEAVAFSPAFATTGSAVFYHSAAVGNSAIVRADTGESGEVLRVTSIVNDDAQNFHARPSPDGKMIAFDSDRQGERAVYVADADGHNVKRVSGEGFAAVPSWAPDGRRLAFVRAEPNRPRVWNLWTVDLASGETTRLTSHSVGQPWGAAWFPDGERIAYSHEDRLIVRTLDGRSQQIFPSPRKGRLLRTPAVSPDGRRVIFQVFRDGGWILDLNDGSMTRILTDPTAEEFSWSPDGQRVAYHSRKSGTWSVWMMAPR